MSGISDDNFDPYRLTFNRSYYTIHSCLKPWEKGDPPIAMSEKYRLDLIASINER
jgi:hypothetical protein